MANARDDGGEAQLTSALEQAMGLPSGSLGAAGNSAKKVKDVPQVWLPGKKTTTQSAAYISGPREAQHGMLQAPKTSMIGKGEYDAQEVSNWVYDSGKLKEITSYLNKKGFDTRSWGAINKSWQDAVQMASDAYGSSGGKLKKSPFDMLDYLAPSEADKKKNEPWRGMSFDTSHTTRHIDQIGPEDAKAVISASLKDLLGRDPTQEEIEDFASRANAIVGQHPQLTNETKHMVWDPNKDGPDQGGYIEDSSSSTTTGGVSDAMLQDAANKQGKDSKDYLPFQAATTVSNWLFNAVNSPVG